MAARTSQSSSRATDPDPTREKLLAAAIEVFASQGFEQATVREICARAGANVASVNYHFRDKLGLYVEALRDKMRPLTAARIEATASTDPEQALRLFVRSVLTHMMSAERVMMHEMARPSPALPIVVEEIIRPTYQYLCQTIGRMMKRPASHKRVRLSVHSLIGQVVHYVHSQPVIDIVWPELQQMRQPTVMIADHIVDVTLCSLQTKAKQKPPPRSTL